MLTTIIRYANANDSGPPRVGVLDDQGRLRPLAVSMIHDLLRVRSDEVRSLVEVALRSPVLESEGIRRLAPVDGLTEVWASGVTYERSRDARFEESSTKDIYAKVYEAERPELFFKAPAWRVVPDGQPVAVRVDSRQNVAEPELILVLNAFAEVVGYSVGNDMSSRDIEGANPLYLPQAKIYDASFSMAGGIRPAWQVRDAAALEIEMSVVRSGSVVWRGSTNTRRIVRTFGDLVEHLFRCYSLPHGALLCTGTGIVPEIGFTAESGDVVRIEIEAVGTLSNPVIETGVVRRSQPSMEGA